MHERSSPEDGAEALIQAILASNEGPDPAFIMQAVKDRFNQAATLRSAGCRFREQLVPRFVQVDRAPYSPRPNGVGFTQPGIGPHNAIALTGTIGAQQVLTL